MGRLNLPLSGDFYTTVYTVDGGESFAVEDSNFLTDRLFVRTAVGFNASLLGYLGESSFVTFPSDALLIR
jgi:hypothetical protein